MALPGEPLSIVEQWKKKSSEMSSDSNDSIVPLLAKGIDTICIVLNKKSDSNRVKRALASLESERSLSLEFDNIKNNEVRSLVYGHIQCLHFALNELTKERNQVKEYEEMFTQTDQEESQPSLIQSLLSDQVKESSEIFTQTAKIPNLFELPKEEPFDENSIKIEDLWGDEMEIKDEEMCNDNVENNNANEDGDRGDVSNIENNDEIAQSEMPALNNMGDESNFENVDVDETMNGSKDNEIMEEDREKDSFETVEVEKRRSSRKASKPVRLAGNPSLEYSDDDSGPIMKKRKKELSKIKKKSSGTVEKKGGSLSSKGESREMKCTECEYQAKTASSFTQHLRYAHSTTLGLAGLALRCDCGVEVLSHMHKCENANFMVIRKRDGPIKRFNDEKTTPQCLLCDKYPTTAMGYITHLQRHHNSVVSAHGVFLQCLCGTKYYNYTPNCQHTKECSRREFSLHKVVDK